MSFFVFPAHWIKAAILAAATAMGSTGHTTHIHYTNLPRSTAGQAALPSEIIVDKRPRSAWTRDKAMCLIAHEYGHLRGRKHSDNPLSIMFPFFERKNCHRWLVRHHAIR
jgi:Matrixin